MLTSDLDYRLPEGLIAQRPAFPRDYSRLMVVDARKQSIEHRVFRDLPAFLRPGDAVVLNETKVLPARLTARRPGGGETELLFLRDLGSNGNLWEVMARPSRRLRAGMALWIGDEELQAVKPLGEGRWVMAGTDVPGTLRRHGHMPLPPYIESTPEAEREYQTVYARNEGSAAAPTAGLHFTREVLGEVEKAGARISRVTLHVGPGTFSPVRTEKLADHRMHAEHYRVPDEAARAVGDAKRVVAVGTTVVRTLESWAATGVREGESELFIRPGYRWLAVDILLTNFHLPRSTLLAMVMAFAGEELIREAYEVAVKERYRFFSFGDAMLLVGGGRAL
ncbi:MAG: S-adenosylmethionine:tRNA ribosyltransferase-isomerase [uncultured Rubrobacteraceae bacterium]|uniref:S-adenosylmethionine:tRNA ribosyltransferase-isomerase n=1 Tax=uncultured Rubrobacteraceae bacterium TaxID=349277 RepID=A0A6J4PWE5_9ACTN|nr:MAG: S-adenosylmethionine:tRNA ribosyltransferase-isomerase [uncultured Rubrobacteraceae bacterium]